MQRNIFLVAIAAIVLVILGAAHPVWFFVGLAILIGILVIYHFWSSIRLEIHNMFRAIPLELQYGTWLLLTLIGSIGALTYLNGTPSRAVNTTLYFVSLVFAVLYMHRRIAENGFYRFWAVVWSFMIICSTWNLIPFVGWLLGAIDVVLFWHFHYIADRSHQTQQPQPRNFKNRTNSFTAVNSLHSYEDRKTVEQISTGSIQWKFYPKKQSGRICSFKPLMWCHIPQFWRRIDFVKNGQAILIEEYRWFHLANRTNLGQIYDPDFDDTIGNWIISLICRNKQIRLIRGGKKKDGEHEEVLRIRLHNGEAERVLSCVDVLIQETCAFQGLKRLGRL